MASEVLDGLGRLPDSWTAPVLGAVLIDGTRNGIYKPKQFHGRGCKIVNMGELFAHPRLGAVDMERVDLTAEEKGRFLLKSGDLLFARRSLVAEGAGKCCLVVEADEETTFESSIIRARPNCAVADSAFLFYTFSSPYGRHALGTILRHVAVAGITGKDLVGLRVPLPPLDEQRRIAAILGALDDKIDLNRKMNRTLEEAAQAIFKSWFVDFHDVPEAEMVGSKLGPIPGGWRVDEIGSVVTVVGGSTPSTKEPGFWENGTHCWTTPKDLSATTCPLLLDTERRITDAGLATISSRLLPAGTFLLSSRAPVGYTAVTRVPVAVNQGYIAIPPGGQLSSLFLLHWAKANLETIKGRAGGTTFQEISKRNFRPIPVVVPSKPKLAEFDRVVGAIFDKIENGERQNRSLAALRDALLPKLISGEIRVPEAEEAVEAAL